MSFIFVKHFELPCVERCYINKLALPHYVSTNNLVIIYVLSQGDCNMCPGFLAHLEMSINVHSTSEYINT